MYATRSLFLKQVNIVLSLNKILTINNKFNTKQGRDSIKAGSEEIEALIYPSDSAYEALGQKREEDFNSAQINQRIQNEVSKVNKTLQPYARITRITILENPLEMTTTKKIKRNYKKQNKCLK